KKIATKGTKETDSFVPFVAIFSRLRAVISLFYPIRLMVVFEAAPAAFPIAVKIHLAVVMWRGPYRALIRRLCPITGMPLVILSVWIPITRDPDKLRARPRRHNAQRPRGR